MPLARLERALPKKLDFESSASTNSATGAPSMGPRLAEARHGHNGSGDFASLPLPLADQALRAPATSLCNREWSGSFPAMICLSQIGSERPR